MPYIDWAFGIKLDTNELIIDYCLKQEEPVDLEFFRVNMQDNGNVFNSAEKKLVNREKQNRHIVNGFSNSLRSEERSVGKEGRYRGSPYE